MAPPDFVSSGSTAGVDPLSSGRALLASDMDRFHVVLEEALAPQASYLTNTERELYRRGKKLRPLMLLATARMIGPSAPEDVLPGKVIKGAVALEMLHVATLIHDDIVDAAPARRGLISVNADRGTETAVLVGDLQFIQAVRCFAADIDSERDMELVRTVLDVAFKICCGELDELQTDVSSSTPQLVARYHRTIDRKTAVLFGLACESGATLMGAGTRITYCVSQFGRLFGRAFQIMDDLLDLLQPEAISGKQRGTDILERRLSLPIIYALAELPGDHVLHAILRGHAPTPSELESAIEAIIAAPGFMRCYAEARELTLQATAMLDGFPPSAYRDWLVAQAAHLVDRDFE
jgi:heptaprenyl diphosphate synthase